MKSALNKDFFREISKSKGRFLSIVAIVALGVSFFTGVKCAPIVMKTSSDKYYDDYNLMDIRVASTLGLTYKDVKKISQINGVEGVYPTYSIDAISTYNSSEKVIKVQGLDLNKLNDNKNYINKVDLIQGRLPNKSGECVVEVPKIKPLNYKIGTKITLTSGNDNKLSDSLEKNKYTVVGYVQTPYYLSHEKGNSSIGGGVVEGVIMVPQSDFKMGAYTDIFLTVNSAKKLDTYSDDYFDLVGKVTSQIEGIKGELQETRYKEVLKEAKDKLKEGETKLNKAKYDLEKAKDQYEKNKVKAQQKLIDAQNTINKSNEQIENAEVELKNEKEKTYNQIKEGQSQINQAEESLKKAKKEYEESLTEFNVKKELAQKEIGSSQLQLDELLNQINSLKQSNSLIENQLNNTNISEEEKNELQNKLNKNLYLLSTLEINYKNGMDSLEESKEQLKQGEIKLEESKTTLQRSEEKLDKEKTNLNSYKIIADKKFKEAEEGLKSNKLELEEGQKELNINKGIVEIQLKEAKEKLNEGEEKIKNKESDIKEAKKKIGKIEKPTLYILNRNSHQSFVEYEGCANSIDALAKIFPVFFFAVGALVCLTTMTRMVDEQRINIGTLKALGYRIGQISKKYIMYALVACLIGSILGLAVGFTLFPTVIFFAYGMMYSIPNIIYIFSIPIATGITSVAVLVITSSSYLACYKELRETPAILMRPRAPKSGKRILIERIPFIWNKFSFISKVTVRNIFRYKKRFLMTVLGISGCTALILAGFGIKDSIEIIVTGQYGTLFKYDMSLVTESNLNETEMNVLKNELSNLNDVNKYEFFSYQNGDIKVDNTRKEITIVVPQNLNKLDEFIHLQDRKSKKPIELNDDGIVITEKIAKDLDIKLGDKIELINSNNKKVSVEIIGITENYISHYAYVSPNNYNKLFKTNLDYNRILGILNNPNTQMEEKLSKKLFEIKTIDGVGFNTSAKETFHNTIKNLNYVVLIMIISAGALAFVVLYNLTNVNISERIREIATIKVLGFYDNEVSAYIYRENIILTIIGTIVGLEVGTILHQFIMRTVEIQSMMFGRVISVRSYFIATILTIILSLFVNVAMFYKLKNIKMVESLKSID